MVSISNKNQLFMKHSKLISLFFLYFLFVNLANGQTVTKTERTVDKFLDLIKMISKKSFDEKFLTDIFHKKYVRLVVTTSIPSVAATQRYTQPGLNGG